jgi:hypothetical protein
MKPPKIADQAIFYLANCQSSPFLGDFLRHQAQKIPIIRHPFTFAAPWLGLEP